MQTTIKSFFIITSLWCTFSILSLERESDQHLGNWIDTPQPKVYSIWSVPNIDRRKIDPKEALMKTHLRLAKIGSKTAEIEDAYLRTKLTALGLGYKEVESRVERVQLVRLGESEQKIEDDKKNKRARRRVTNKDFVRAVPSSVYVAAKVVPFALKKSPNTKLVAWQNQLRREKQFEQTIPKISSSKEQQTPALPVLASSSSSAVVPDSIEGVKLMLRLAETAEQFHASTIQGYNQHQNPKNKKKNYRVFTMEAAY